MDCSSTLRDAIACLAESLSADPTWFEWLALLVFPLLATAATTLVAIASWSTSKRATEISEGAAKLAKDAYDAEVKRAGEEVDRVERSWEMDYQARLDGHFANLFEAVGEYSAAVDAWIDEAGELEMNWRGNPDDIPYSPRPSRALLDARLQSVMLHARGDDRIVLGKIDGYIRAVGRSPSAWKQSPRLTFLVELIRMWRDGSCTSGTFMSRLKRKRTTVEADRDLPPRRS